MKYLWEGVQQKWPRKLKCECYTLWVVYKKTTSYNHYNLALFSEDFPAFPHQESPQRTTRSLQIIQGIHRNWTVSTNLKSQPWHLVGETTKIMRNTSQNSHAPHQDLKLGSPKYKARVQPNYFSNSTYSFISIQPLGRF